MTEINKFNLSKIYVIKSPQTDLYYIGSTTLPLCKRFTRHKADYKSYLKGIFPFITSFKIIELGDAYIELLEEVNCENRKQLEKHEGGLIKLHKSNCVNKIMVGRTKNEYKNDNKEMIKQDGKQYYIDNCDRIKERVNQYRIDNLDKIRELKKQYGIDNADKIRERKKQYRIDNADKIREQKKKYRIDNADKIKEKQRIKYAETKLLKDLALITI